MDRIQTSRSIEVVGSGLREHSVVLVCNGPAISVIVPDVRQRLIPRHLLLVFGEQHGINFVKQQLISPVLFGVEVVIHHHTALRIYCADVLGVVFVQIAEDLLARWPHIVQIATTLVPVFLIFVHNLLHFVAD